MAFVVTNLKTPSQIDPDLDVAEIAWVAGFLEGEGYFDMHHGKPRIGANQVNREPLERLRRMWGGTIYHRNQEHNARRSWYGWEVRDQQTIAEIVAFIRPWLSTERLQRIPWLVTEASPVT